MKIYWTKKSLVRFNEISSFIEKEFGEVTSKKFRDKVFNFLALLRQFPELGSIEVPEKNIRGFQISSQTRIFYRIHKNHISLLTFFDSRQDPKNKPN